LAAFLASAPAVLRAQGRDSIPTQSYYVNFADFHDGRYARALKGFQSDGRSAIKGINGRWIDSICYYTMAGECYYQMGQYTEALDQYTAALTLYSRYSDWLLRVHATPLRQAALGKVKPVPWGRSARTAQVADLPDQFMMSRGQLNNNEALRSGGIVQQPSLFPIQAQEIVRCTCLALRRRRELLGPAGAHDPLSTELVNALLRRPVAPNDWKDAWIDVQLALAFSAAGNDGQAKGHLQRGLIAGGQYDHNLTAVALFELGRIAFSQGEFREAAGLFTEASYSAFHFMDAALLEESLRYGHMANLLAGNAIPYPPLTEAANWARVKDATVMQASCMIMAAEDLVNQGRGAQAADLLANARGVVGTREMGRGKLGARLNYILAQALYQQGKIAAGDEALAGVLAFQRGGASLWMFHIGLVDALYTQGKVSSRMAMTLYDDVLRDPQSADWKTEPLESLSVLVTPHPLPIEHWFEAALDRKEYETALEISDLARRHRFFSTLPLGGRLLGLRWMMEGPADLLNQQAALDKQDLLNRHAAWQGLAQQARQLRTELSQLPLAPDDLPTQKEQADRLAKLTQVSQLQEALLREIAVRREPGSLIFPPRRKIKEIQQSLPEGTAVLVFFATSKQLYGCLISRDKYPIWPIAASTISRQMATVLRSMGHFDGNRQVPIEELAGDEWKQAGRVLFDQLTKGSKLELPAEFQELVIVPDGLLWYLPFEALPAAADGATQPLLLSCRVRYAPTLSLALPDARTRKRSMSTGVVVGKLFPGVEDSVAQEAFAQFSQAVGGSVALRAPLPASSSVYAALFDRLVVLDDIAASESGGYDWAPLTLDRNVLGSSVDHWMQLPWGGPEELILPGFHTPAEGALKKVANPPGSDVFLAVCGLMASGSRTVLISRWRTGGQTSFDLVREFARELPHSGASYAWQRSVFLLHSQPIDPPLEPRIRANLTAPPAMASHPFFWAGYLLVDTGSPPLAADDPPGEAVLIK
jgi:tetratricopeptide (TPR) repeat protein